MAYRIRPAAVGGLLATVAAGAGIWYLTCSGVQADPATPENPTRAVQEHTNQPTGQTPQAPQEDPWVTSLRSIKTTYDTGTREPAAEFVRGVFRDLGTAKTGYDQRVSESEKRILNPERRQYLEEAQRTVEQELGVQKEGQ